MLLEPVLLLLLVLTRISALIMTAPTLGIQAAPMQVRAFVALGLSLLIAPVQWSQAPGMPPNLIELVVMLLREAILGLSLGIALMILVAGLQLAGHVMGQLSGMQLAELFDPSFDNHTPVTAKLLELTAIAVFFGIGGHQQVLEAMLTSFRQVPPGSAVWAESLLSALLVTTQQSFVVGLRAAAPVALSILLATLIVGLIGRTLPQMNILAVGFTLNAFVLFGMLGVSVTAACWLFSDEAETAIRVVRDAFDAIELSR